MGWELKTAERCSALFLVVPVQALDALTPLGRGQTLLVTGEPRSGKSALVLDAILGQYRSGVRCIYAAIGQRCAQSCPCTAAY